MQFLQSRKVAIAALLLAAILWSTAGLAFALITTVDNGIARSGYRSLFAAIFYIIAFRSLPKMETGKWFKFAIVGYMFATTLFAIANTLTTAANAIVLQYTAPIFACLYLFFIFRKPLPRYDIIATAIIFLGICIFFVDSVTLQFSPAMTTGNVVAIASGAGFGFLAVSLGKTTTPRNVVTFGNIANVIIALPFMIMFPIGSLIDLGMFIYLGVIQLGLAYLLFTFAVPKVTPLELILIPALEPILNPIWVFIFDGQTPSVLAVVGGVIIIATIVIWSVYKNRRNL